MKIEEFSESQLADIARKAVDMTRRLDNYDRHAKLPIRVPDDDDEARRLCGGVFGDPSQATTTEIALARYLLHRMGPEAAPKDRQEPRHPGHIRSDMRLSGRVIERCILMPQSADAPLPMRLEFQFTDRARLILVAQSAVTLVEADGTSKTVPSIPATTTIDDVLARGVDPT